MRKRLIFISIILVTLLDASYKEFNNRKPIDFSMTISGGVSLGAYQAGYNWAVIKMLSQMKELSPYLNPTLRSISGASAGSINALLASVYWCQKPTINLKNRVDNNLFFDTWVNLGIEDLIIEGRDKNNRSTLFTRKFLYKKADNIMTHMNKSIYKKGCEVPIGFSVTKATPIIEEFQGVKIRNQHFSVPFTLKEQGGKLRIKNRKMPPSTDFFISIPEIDKDYTKVTDVLFASSAFPGAFQQVKLKYKYKNKLRYSYFIDGGAYDNIPLQLATELNPDSKLFLFMDPSNMRKEKEITEKEENEEKPIGFLTSSASPLSSAVEIFQQMKLYEAINKYFKNDSSMRLILSSRYHPLTAGFLEHFGAFMDRSFRMYDYNVGVYDAIHHFATSLHQQKLHSDKSTVETMNLLIKYLGIDQNPDALIAYKFFLSKEFNTPKPKKKNKYEVIYDSFDVTVRDKKRYSNEKFKEFLSKLDLTYLPHTDKSFIYYATKNPEDWYKKPVRYIVNRVTTLENDRAEVYPEYQPVATAMNFGAWAGNSFTDNKEGWEFFPINAPFDEGKDNLRIALKFMPSEFAIDTVNGGLSLGYGIYWNQTMEYIDGIEIKPSYNFNDSVGDFIRADINVFTKFGDTLKLGGGLSGFGNIEDSFYDKETAYGINLYIDALDIFRFTYVRRHGGLDAIHLSVFSSLHPSVSTCIQPSI
ncbi:MAG: patatin-like phospholipase family protein [Sulfurovum sp.]|nr:patatin-like phospholipase family protein [Sulfurovaceae bacterium]